MDGLNNVNASISKVYATQRLQDHHFIPADLRANDTAKAGFKCGPVKGGLNILYQDGLKVENESLKIDAAPSTPSDIRVDGELAWYIASLAMGPCQNDQYCKHSKHADSRFASAFVCVQGACLLGMCPRQIR